MQYIWFTVFLELLSCFQYFDVLECNDSCNEEWCLCSLHWLLLQAGPVVSPLQSMLRACTSESLWHMVWRDLGIDSAVAAGSYSRPCFWAKIRQLGLSSQSGCATCKYKVLESELGMLWLRQIHNFNTTDPPSVCVCSAIQQQAESEPG